MLHSIHTSWKTKNPANRKAYVRAAHARDVSPLLETKISLRAPPCRPQLKCLNSFVADCRYVVCLSVEPGQEGGAWGGLGSKGPPFATLFTGPFFSKHHCCWKM